MPRKLSIATLAIVLATMSVAAHDLFLKLDSYFLPPNSKAIVRVLNGTFQKSEGAVARERLADLSVFANGVAMANPSSCALSLWERVGVRA
jgi:hypothetical protein